MGEFALHWQLEADTCLLVDWPLSRVLLMNDARYPWLVLVPRRVNLHELHDLCAADRATAIEEIARASNALKTLMGAAKINVGALGNLVSQLHIHIVARSPGDAAWPGAIWGPGQPIPYGAPAREALVGKLQPALQQALARGLPHSGE